MVICSIEGIILDVNEEACKLFGMTRAKLMGSNLSSHIEFHSVSSHEEVMSKFYAQEMGKNSAEREMRVIDRNGSLLRVNFKYSEDFTLPDERRLVLEMHSRVLEKGDMWEFTEMIDQTLAEASKSLLLDFGKHFDSAMKPEEPKNGVLSIDPSNCVLQEPLEKGYTSQKMYCGEIEGLSCAVRVHTVASEDQRNKFQETLRVYKQLCDTNPASSSISTIKFFNVSELRFHIFFPLHSTSLFLEQERNAPTLLPSVCILACHEVVNAISFLHSNNLFHGAINSKNLLISNPQSKSPSFVLSEPSHLQPKRGIQNMFEDWDEKLYWPPEALLSGQMDHKGDIFSLGRLVVDLVSMRRPFSDTPTNKILENKQILSDQLTCMPPDCKEFHSSLFYVHKKCCQPSSTRVSLQELKSFLQDLI